MVYDHHSTDIEYQYRLLPTEARPKRMDDRGLHFVVVDPGTFEASSADLRRAPLISSMHTTLWNRSPIRN